MHWYLSYSAQNRYFTECPKDQYKYFKEYFIIRRDCVDSLGLGSINDACEPERVLNECFITGVRIAHSEGTARTRCLDNSIQNDFSELPTTASANRRDCLGFRVSAAPVREDYLDLVPQQRRLEENVGTQRFDTTNHQRLFGL